MKLLKKYWFPLLLICLAAWLCTVVPAVNINYLPPENARVPGMGLASTAALSTVDGLNCETEQAVYPKNASEVTVILRNFSGDTIGYGEHWSLERLVGSQWHKLDPAPMPPDSSEHSVLDVMYFSHDKTSPHIECQMAHYGDWFSPGHYRIILGVNTMDDPPIDYTLAAEFDMK